MKYDLWKNLVETFFYKITHISPNDISVDLEKLYSNKFHPYTAAVVCILKSDSYKKKKFFHSFVIPYEHEIIVMDIHCNSV